jgi:catecholate siderophore receptor
VLIRKRTPVAKAGSTPLVTTAVGLALGTLGVPASSRAEPAADSPQIIIRGEREGDFKVEQASSPKYTAPLRDTPQTFTVVPRQVIEDQSLLTMREILSTVPGITFGAGEGGGGYGDSINLRGFAGSTDITVDGIRDSAQYTRSDPFNLELIEVINGASSVYAGAGAVGGSVNLVSKAPQVERPFYRFSGSAATDDYGRFTADLNQNFGSRNAARLNAMWHENDVPGRDVERYERWGIAPSVSLGFGDATTLTLGYFHQEDDNIPQYGVPTFEGSVIPGVDVEAYYGNRNIDTQQIDTDILNAVVRHDFNPRLALRNHTRAQRVDQLSIVSQPQGVFCLASTGLTPAGALCPSGSALLPPGFFQPTGSRGTTRDTSNEAIINQTDFIASFKTGRYEHTMVTGLAISHETFSLRTGNVLRNADGSTPVFAQTPIGDPDSFYTGPHNFILAGLTDGELDNQALYAFDTLKLSERWQLNAGARYEHNDGTFVSSTVATPAAGGAVTRQPRVDTEDYLFSYRAGVVYKPAEHGSIYLAYGNSQTPSRASVNGTCNLLPTATNGANCNVDPEDAVNYELGTKWDLLNGELAITAALFRNERTNYRVNDFGNEENPTQEQRLDGKARVDGVVLGIGGLLRDGWGVYANYSYLDSEVLQGASDFVSSQGQDYAKGDRLLNVPENAFSLWTVYDLPRRMQVGYGVTYQDKVHVGQHNQDNPAGALPTAAGYTVHRAMIRYGMTRSVDLQFNVNNIFDEEYLTRVRTSTNVQGWATPGERRQFVLTASYSF